MKLGIDFGTTRVVVAAVDRGNYPVVSFETADGATEEWFPPLVAIRGDERLYGWEAYAMQADPCWTVIRSLKRLLDEAGPNTRLEIGHQTIGLMELLRSIAGALLQSLRERSSLQLKPGEKLEVMLGVPANANSNQRFLTAEAFRQAGFEVLGILNEPSAASIEFGHRNASKGLQRLVVYDLGGGTFDASLVEHDDKMHWVVANEGIATLGGDDFDHLLAEIALEQVGLQLDELSQGESFRLLEECRVKKESLHPNTRKITVDLGVVREGLPVASVPVSDYFERARPYVEETLHAVNDLIAKSGLDVIDTLYVTGGGSELPLIGRVLREEFGRKMKRSSHSRSATAIGLAIQADASAGYELRDQFTRNFGVWREADCGRRIIFDPLFVKGTPLPAPGESSAAIQRRYQPVHNIGHFRYLECSYVNEFGQPAGDITIWDEIQFPFDPALQGRADLQSISVELCERARGERIEESYRLSPEGLVVVAIRDLVSGYEQSWSLGRWAPKTTTIKATRKRKSRSRSNSA
ncbi:MAG: Hsp70 family protein [Bryobacteraceae bacterium]|nr:Hsp70 family protein [Bryobacteraceae bacterium]MDW8379765.1 Hsp70 family protein [Bryobacterales bacterium]